MPDKNAENIENTELEVCKCPYCKTGEGVLGPNGAFFCYCGASWAGWYAKEQKMVINKKKKTAIKTTTNAILEPIKVIPPTPILSPNQDSAKTKNVPKINKE